MSTDPSVSRSMFIQGTSILGQASAVQLWALASGFLLVYIVGTIIYRLFLSPIARIPGRKIAGVTWLYSFYYDFICKGRYIWEIEEMHKQYGPIVRIYPDTVHINDPDYIDQIYTGAAHRRDKGSFLAGGLAAPNAALGTLEHSAHRRRRNALNPFFSKQAIRRLEPIIHRVLDTAFLRLDEHAESGTILRTNLFFGAITGDIIGNYCFGPSEGHLDRKDLNASFFDSWNVIIQEYYVTVFFPFLPTVFRTFPLAFVLWLNPHIKVWLDLLKKITVNLNKARVAKEGSEYADSIFYRLLNGDLPESDKTEERMLDEARVMLAAGTETTAQTLSAITYHMLTNPDMLKRLKAELEEAIPDPSVLPNAIRTEQLPYLTAVVTEALRLHPGAASRLERIAPDEDLFYEDKKGNRYKIPRGTVMAMTAPLINRNEQIYPSPLEYLPERFLESPRLADRYLFTFGRGTRRCLGMNLAYQELYLVTAALFRKYDLYDGTGRQKGPTLELHDTTREDVDVDFDIVTPGIKKGHVGPRLILRK